MAHAIDPSLLREGATLLRQMGTDRLAREIEVAVDTLASRLDKTGAGEGE